MLSENEMKLARSGLLRAAQIIGFKVITPYSIEVEGVKKEVFAYLPEYGSPKGLILLITSEPEYYFDIEITSWCKLNKYYCPLGSAKFYIEFEEKDAQSFKEKLDHWGKFQ